MIKPTVIMVNMLIMCADIEDWVYFGINTNNHLVVFNIRKIFRIIFKDWMGKIG